MKTIGVDLGGHKIAAAAVDFSDGIAEILARSLRPTPPGRDADAVLRELADMIASISGGEKIESVGIGLPGFINKNQRGIEKLTNFPGFENVEFTGLLGKILAGRGIDAEIYIENDANCFALGEGVSGAARGMSDYVVLTLGTGIGGGIVAGGCLLTGAHGFAGEVGHIAAGRERPCMCGGFSHIESLAGADAVEKAAIAAGLPGDFAKLWKMRSETKAYEILAPALDALARCVASVSVITDPEIVILNGGVSRAESLAEELTPVILKYLPLPYRPRFRLEVSKLGNDAVFYGASALGAYRHNGGLDRSELFS